MKIKLDHGGLIFIGSQQEISSFLDKLLLIEKELYIEVTHVENSSKLEFHFLKSGDDFDYYRKISDKNFLFYVSEDSHEIITIKQEELNESESFSTPEFIDFLDEKSKSNPNPLKRKHLRTYLQIV